MANDSSSTLLTAEEYGAIPDDDTRNELVRGRIVYLQFPEWRHGLVCGNVMFLFGGSEVDRQGHACANIGVITARNPDTVRAVDFVYYSYAKMPRDECPDSYALVEPDLVVEVKSCFETWRDIYVKVGELLEIGVELACVADPERKQLQVFRPDHPVRILNCDDTLEIPEIHPGFSAPVRRIFTQVRPVRFVILRLPCKYGSAAPE